MPTLSIDLTASQATRVQAALKKQLSMTTNPTMAEIQEWVKGQMRLVVFSQERRTAELAITDTAFDPS